MIRRLTCSCLCAAVIACGAGPSSAATIDGIAATVNGEVITLLDLEKAGQPLVERQLSTAVKRERAKVKREVLLSVLDGLILQELQKQRARELGLQVSDQELTEAIAQIRERNALTEEMMGRALKEQGITMEEYREQVSEQVLFSKLMQQEVRTRVAVTGEELEAYYDEHKEDYFRPESIRVRHLLVKAAAGESEESLQEARGKALEILDEFRGGADFAELVRRHSPETAAGDDAVSGWLQRGEFLQELEEVAFSLPAGSVSEPIRSQVGFHLIQVVEKDEASYLSLAAVSESIEQKLMEGKMEQNYKKWLQELREDSHVQILY